jgi:hypothetical protein
MIMTSPICRNMQMHRVSEVTCIGEWNCRPWLRNLIILSVTTPQQGTNPLTFIQIEVIPPFHCRKISEPRYRRIKRSTHLRRECNTHHMCATS